MSVKKKIFGLINEKTLADFKLKLRHDGLTQSAFVTTIIDIYVENPVFFLPTLAEINLRASKFSKTRSLETDSLYKKGLEDLGQFELSEQEKASIFDILEQEIGDL